MPSVTTIPSEVHRPVVAELLEDTYGKKIRIK